jgi:hypothetical protein
VSHSGHVAFLAPQEIGTWPSGIRPDFGKMT